MLLWIVCGMLFSYLELLSEVQVSVHTANCGGYILSSRWQERNRYYRGGLDLTRSLGITMRQAVPLELKFEMQIVKGERIISLGFMWNSARLRV